MKKDAAIVWFRQDLRLHDNEALWEARKAAEKVIPVFVFDERVFCGETSYGFSKTGVHRAQFILESVANLRKSLQKKNSDLIIRFGKPEEILSALSQDYNAAWIYCNRERTQEEVDVQNALERRLWQTGKELRYTRGKMLYYTADLPFPIMHTPDNFTSFRKEVERFIQVRDPLPSETLDFDEIPDDIETGSLPTLGDFGFNEKDISSSRTKGGETEALSRLRYYLWESDLVSKYKETRNGLLGKDYSSKFSAYLAQGCLSPKTAYSEIKKYEDERESNESTYHLVFELLWRDYFRLVAKKHGNAIFQLGGLKDNGHKEWKNDRESFDKWASGRTGIPFIDANMRELNKTGFMSNRGRQNVASFLVNDLELNWILGAEYFESKLIDYDPCSNYGNWNYLAGVGSDPRSERYFNVFSQAKRYDPQGIFVKHWIPELANLSESDIHLPDQNSDSVEHEDQEISRYPKPMINTSRWL